ncbi:MAG: YkvA family protein [Anaerolineales bacterium]|jgi:uncharacterized membrane protein YkvA (DUF1232 family)
MRAWARHLKSETYALYLAYKDPRTPWYARILVAFVVAHTLSPIDLIPDFIPVLGYLDDLIITPVGLWLALKLIPPDVIQAARLQAQAKMEISPSVSLIGLLIVICIWLLGLALLLTLGWQLYHPD